MTPYERLLADPMKWISIIADPMCSSKRAPAWSGRSQRNEVDRPERPRADLPGPAVSLGWTKDPINWDMEGLYELQRLERGSGEANRHAVLRDLPPRSTRQTGTKWRQRRHRLASIRWRGRVFAVVAPLRERFRAVHHLLCRVTPDADDSAGPRSPIEYLCSVHDDSGGCGRDKPFSVQR